MENKAPNKNDFLNIYFKALKDLKERNGNTSNLIESLMSLAGMLIYDRQIPQNIKDMLVKEMDFLVSELEEVQNLENSVIEIDEETLLNFQEISEITTESP